jgi:hypothetical protein
VRHLPGRVHLEVGHLGGVARGWSGKLRRCCLPPLPARC